MSNKHQLFLRHGSQQESTTSQGASQPQVGSQGAAQTGSQGAAQAGSQVSQQWCFRENMSNRHQLLRAQGSQQGSGSQLHAGSHGASQPQFGSAAHTGSTSQQLSPLLHQSNRPTALASAEVKAIIATASRAGTITRRIVRSPLFRWLGRFLFATLEPQHVRTAIRPLRSHRRSQYRRSRRGVVGRPACGGASSKHRRSGAHMLLSSLVASRLRRSHQNLSTRVRFVVNNGAYPVFDVSTGCAGLMENRTNTASRFLPTDWTMQTLFTSLPQQSSHRERVPQAIPDARATSLAQP